MRSIVLVWLLVGCSLDRTGRGADASFDGGTIDGGEHPDAGRIDAGPTDAGPPDGGPPDAYLPPTLCPLDPDLVACWPLDGDGVDHGARANDLAVTGVTWEPGGGVHLDASSGLVRAVRPELRHARVAADVWVRVDAFPAAGARAGILDHDGHFGMFLGPDGELRCAGGIYAATALSVPAALALGTWQHVACVADGASLSLYVDGLVRASMPGAPVGAPGDAPLHLGENAPDGNDQLLGALDDVRLWDRPRTTEEIQADVARGRIVVP